mmetsp:Transcript_5601/g.19579  ORF Transcript_5601/g.19579 Transcript_5601/m.19579 type:complete len:322 (+) Transcript_5601:865-1830(+)
MHLARFVMQFWLFNVRGLLLLLDVVHEQADEEGGFSWIGHPQDGTLISRGTIVSTDREPIAHVQRLVGLYLQVIHERLKPHGLVSDVHKDVVPTVERTAGHFGSGQVVLGGEGDVFQHFVDGGLLRQDSDAPLFSQELHFQSQVGRGFKEHVLRFGQEFFDVFFFPRSHGLRLPFFVRHEFQPVFFGDAKQIIAFTTHDVESIGDCFGQVELLEGRQQPPYSSLELGDVSWISSSGDDGHVHVGTQECHDVSNDLVFLFDVMSVGVERAVCIESDESQLFGRRTKLCDVQHVSDFREVRLDEPTSQQRRVFVVLFQRFHQT